jgi:glucosamine-6-phosphate deaminase
MYKHFFSHIDINPFNVNILDGNAPDLDSECLQYEEKINRAGGIELFLGGIGPDGHIAFNEPGSSLKSLTRVKTLAYDTILANSRFFDNDINKVPKMALTVGIQTILDAREVVCIILGSHKALALRKCIEEPINHMWTLSSLQMHPHAFLVVDSDATLELRVKTVRYFCEIESVSEICGMSQALPTADEVGGKKLEIAKKLDSLDCPSKDRSNSEIFSDSIAMDDDALLKPPQSIQTTALIRSPTPELSPDRMGSRLAATALNNSSTSGDLRFDNMHMRIDAVH